MYHAQKTGNICSLIFEQFKGIVVSIMRIGEDHQIQAL